MTWTTEKLHRYSVGNPWKMAIKAYRHPATCVLRPNQLCLNYSANHTDLDTSPTQFRLHTDATAFHLIGLRSGVPSFPWSSLHGRCTLHTCCRWFDLLSLCLLTFHPHANELFFFKAELEEIRWKLFFFVCGHTGNLSFTSLFGYLLFFLLFFVCRARSSDLARLSIRG